MEFGHEQWGGSIRFDPKRSTLNVPCFMVAFVTNECKFELMAISDRDGITVLTGEVVSRVLAGLLECRVGDLQVPGPLGCLPCTGSRPSMLPILIQ